MYVILLTYEADLARIDQLMPEHVAFLRQCYDAGLFVASGRREPRTGGVILASGGTRRDIEDIMRMDPLVRAGAASFEIVPFRVSQRQTGFVWE